MKLRFVMLGVWTTVLLGILTVLTPAIAQGQSGTKVECGTIIENEFTDNYEQHIYQLNMSAKDSFSIIGEPVGEHLQFYIDVIGPTGLRISHIGISNNPAVKSGLLSASGTYKIVINNSNGGVGLYTLSIGCVTKDGPIEPGNTPQPTDPLPLLTSATSVRGTDTKLTFTGVGFPGLAPVDFADAVTVPLQIGKEMIGIIPLDNQILGFTLDAAAGDTLDLTYTRVSGNMNLGLVVLSAENEVFFQASLVTSASLATQFTLPAAGQYTIGVFRISLVEPEEVEPTVFQVKGTLAE